MPKVLLIDDDVDLCALLADYLQNDGFDVTAVHDGASGIAALKASGADITVLDVMMPGMGGIETLRKIREMSRVPVVMLSARGDGMDRIVGLELGADDYVPKPCTAREIAARLRAILRRVSGQQESVEKSVTGTVVGPLRISSELRRAEWHGVPLDLTSAEFNLLDALAKKAGQVVSKQTLSQHALGRPLERFDRSVDVHVSNIRQKLGVQPDGRSWIQTVRGMGYQFLKA
ncbi:response regulator transcription factor [Burkholderiaceae bacterium DAT-1]|nr:response regulator transcription factor [Burkholderiaceae bacterium DAT-1]